MPVPESVSFVDGLVLALVLVRRTGVMNEGEEARVVRLNVGTDEAGYQAVRPTRAGRSLNRAGRMGWRQRRG